MSHSDAKTPYEICKHYKRHCQLVCAECDGEYPCRLCHDAAVESHQIDRFAVKELVCNECHTRQEKRDTCANCRQSFGEYSCLVCCLFDDDTSKGQFHCEGCKLCRVGGRDNFTHCDRCGCCLPGKGEHKCIESVSKRNCPICLENIHTSRDTATVPPCHHLLHSSCYRKLLKEGLYACPTCGKSLLDLQEHWEKLDQAIRETDLPRYLKDLYCVIYCKDCNLECITSYHVIGLKCKYCGSYNTTRDQSSLLRMKKEPPPQEDSTSPLVLTVPTSPLVLTVPTNKESVMEEKKLYDEVSAETLYRDEILEGNLTAQNEDIPAQDSSDEFAEDQLLEEDDDFYTDENISDDET